MINNKNFINAVFAVFVAVMLISGCRQDQSSDSPQTSESNVVENKNGSSAATAKSSVSPNCSNPYYPVGESIERTYRIDYADAPVPDQNYTEKYTDFNNDTFVANTEFKEVNTRINWRCTPEGLLATQFNNSISMKRGSSATIETLKSSGISFPEESRWKQGEKWTADYQISQTMSEEKGEELGRSEGTVKQSSEIVGAEEITVPAGTFQTFKVKNQTTLDLTVKVKGMSIPTKTTVDSTAWFAKDVGMVKIQNNMSGFGTVTTELLSYKK